MKKITMKNNSFIEAMKLFADQELKISKGKINTNYTVGKIYFWEITMETNKGTKYVRMDFINNSAEEALAMINVFCSAMEARGN